MSTESAIEAFALGMLKSQLRDLTPEKLATVTEEQKANYLQGQRAFAEKQIARFSNPESLYELELRGGLGTHNPNSRKLFTAVTGVDLGKTNTSAREAVIRFIGPEVVARIEAEDRAKAQAEADEKARQKAEKEKARMDRIAANVQSGKEICGDELVDLARSLGIDVHPRTVKLLRDKVRWIKDSSAGIIGKNSGAAFEVFAKVKLAMGAC